MITTEDKLSTEIETELVKLRNEFNTNFENIKKLEKSLNTLFKELCKSVRTITISDNNGEIIATIKNGIWIEEGINLVEKVRSYTLEKNTEENEKFNFPETILLIQSGKGEEVKKIIKRAERQVQRAHRKFTKGRENYIHSY